jgi:hypothetical protein
MTLEVKRIVTGAAILIDAKPTEAIREAETRESRDTRV